MAYEANKVPDISKVSRWVEDIEKKIDRDIQIHMSVYKMYWRFRR